MNRFIVDRTAYLPSSNLFIVEGRVLDGKLKIGDVICTSHAEKKRITIKSIALVNANQCTGSVTLSVERPDFPLGDLEGLELISSD
jgi:hypothetical protein